MVCVCSLIEVSLDLKREVSISYFLDAYLTD